MLATALVASVADPRTFRSGRNFSAWIGLVPRQHSSGGKDRLGSISKQGDRYLRSLFVAGALAVIRYAKIHGTGHRPWLTALLARRPTKVAAIALAALTQACIREESPCQPGAVHTWHLWDMPLHRAMSAFRGNPEDICSQCQRQQLVYLSGVAEPGLCR